MKVSYRFDPAQSRFTVQAFATGLLSFAGHSPAFAVRDFRGRLGFEPDAMTGMTLELSAHVDGLELIGRFSDSDRREIETRMFRDVLQSASYPDASFQADETAADPIAPGRYRLRSVGPLSLHGVTRRHRLDGELQVADDALRVLGECPLRLSDYRIGPVAALGGTIRLKDELKIAYDIIGLREGS